MLNLARSLIERGHRVDLVLPRFVGDYRATIPREMRIYRAKLLYTDRKFLREVRRTGVEVEALTINPVGVARAWRVLDRRFPDLSGKRRYHVYAYAYMTARYIREVGPDLVVAALPGANATAVCAAELTDRAVPTVITVRNNVAADYAPQWRATAQVLFPLADAVVAVSRGVSESVRQSLGMDAERIHVIHNGVPADRIRRLAEEEVAHPWFGQGEPPVIISVGREAPAKGLPHPRDGVRAGAPRGGCAAAHPRSALAALPGAARVAGGRPWRGTGCRLRGLRREPLPLHEKVRAVCACFVLGRACRR